MILHRFQRRLKLLAAGAALMQMPGCTGNPIADVLGAIFSPLTLDLVQTVFLGVTAAGAVAILQNI